MLALGLPIRGATVWRRGREIAHVAFGELDDPNPFLLALSQHATETLLHDALVALGGRVERGIGLTSCANVDGGVRAELAHDDGATDTVDVPWLFAADGSRSAARASLGIDFPGPERPRAWHLVDVPLDTDLEENRAHIVLLDDGFLFLLRVVDGQLHRESPRWRVMGNLPDPLSRLPRGRPVGEPVWTSTFTIAHRVATRLAEGRVYLAGDAAHVHSPAGARGMNLGIEDAFAFARHLREGTLNRYGAARHAVDTRVVRRIERVTALASGETALIRFVRNVALRGVTTLGPLRGVMLNTLSGLDHRAP
jgi:2-polyprenyl-6-methoxyphenol hydroxylase-like FAD-dependent oxidoreductase